MFKILKSYLFKIDAGDEMGILEYLIIILLIIAIILLVALFFKRDNKSFSLFNDELDKKLKNIEMKVEQNKDSINQSLVNYTNTVSTNLNTFKEKIDSNQYELKGNLTETLFKNQKSLKDDLSLFFDNTNKNSNQNSQNMKDDLTKHFDKTNESLNQNKESSIKELNNLKLKITDDLIKFENILVNKMEGKLNEINDKVEMRLDKGFEKTNETFNHIVERISKIDEAQKNIEKLSTEVVSLQDVLTDKKTRGIYGEVELKQLLAAVYGEKNDKIYRLQYTLTTSKIADAVLFAPNPLGMICIDSKFPLENYRKMVDITLSEEKRMEAGKLFKSDVKKHIDAIASKYIILNETANQACMFLPSEAIFAEINAHHPDLVDYSYKNNVWLTSPTTLMAFLTTIQISLQNIERNKYTEEIHIQLEALSDEFVRYKERWTKLKKDIETVSTDVKQIHTTTEKISNRFDKINNVELNQLEE